MSCMSTKYRAYHVNLQGIALSSYELKATDDDAALSEARCLLRLHASLEIWSGARWVARIIQDAPPQFRGHSTRLLFSKDFGV
jgi:hypothetical protein